MPVQNFEINFKNTEGATINPVSLKWYNAAGAPVMVNGAQLTTQVPGTVTTTSDNAQIYVTASAAGYQDKEVSANPGVNNITLQKAGSVGAVADTAKSKWPVILLVIVLIIAAIWAYKKYYKG